MPILEAVRWGKDRKREFATWATSELVNTMGNRAALEKKWLDGIEQWRAVLPTGEKEFPWPGASNLVFPLTAIHADPVYADMMQTLHAPQEYWSVVANRPDRTTHAHPLTEFLRRVESQFVGMRAVNGRALLDNNILGTAVYKAHWLHERKNVRDYVDDGTGTRTIQKRTKIRSHPLVEHVPLQHFWTPAEALSIDADAPVSGARWVAQEIWLTKTELARRAKAEAPFVPNYDKDATAKVMMFEVEKHNSMDSKAQKQEKFEPYRDQRIRLFEVWARFDVDDDGIDEDVVAIVHVESNEVLRALYNPHLHGRRPFHRIRYLPTFGFYGLGLAEADQWAQLTATKLLNATIDNVLLANSRMFSVPLGYMGSDQVYPGKLWYVGPQEQIGEVRLGEVYPSIFNIQSQIMQWSELRTGVNELRQGDISSLPSRTPATSLNSMMQESNKRFDMILADLREVHGAIGLDIVQLLAQWYNDDPFVWQQYCEQTLGAEDARKVIEVLTQGVHEFPETFGVEVTATSSMTNKESEKAKFIGMVQMLSQIFGEMIQISQILMQAPPGTPLFETAASAYSAGAELSARLLEKFDIQNPQDYIGRLQQVASVLVSQGAPAPTAVPPILGQAAGVPYDTGGVAPPLFGQSQVGSLFGL
jgi:hypothetical protein